MAIRITYFTCVTGILLLISTEVLGRTRRFNSAAGGMKRDWCPERCKLTEETRSCADVSNLRESPNITVICQTFLSDNFPSVEFCEEKCQACKIGTVIAQCDKKNIDKKYAVCRLPPRPGVCNGSFMAWYYDPVFGDCKKFVYRGCGGNRNRFNDHISCLERCGFLAILYPGEKARQITHQEL